MDKDYNIFEYGIVIIPEEKCINFAKTLNKIIAQNLPDIENVDNNFHITLYHGAYRKSDIPKIKDLLLRLKVKRFNITFTKFYTTDDRWVDWGVKKTETLQTLHENVVNALSSYHIKPLQRACDLYEIMDDKRKKQVDLYGVSGVMELYNPHMTLFYAYPANKSIEKIPEIIKDQQYENLTCAAENIFITKLGYNGNAIEIVDIIKIN